MTIFNRGSRQFTMFLQYIPKRWNLTQDNVAQYILKSNICAVNIIALYDVITPECFVQDRKPSLFLASIDWLATSFLARKLCTNARNLVFLLSKYCLFLCAASGSAQYIPWRVCMVFASLCGCGYFVRFIWSVGKRIAWLISWGPLRRPASESVYHTTCFSFVFYIGGGGVNPQNRLGKHSMTTTIIRGPVY